MKFPSNELFSVISLIILWQLCEKELWSIHLSGWGLYLITITCHIFLLNQSNLSVLHVWGFKGLSASCWGQAGGAGNPGLVPAPGETEVSMPATGWLLSCCSLGWEWCVSQKTASRRNLHEWSEWGAQCQSLEGAVWQVLRQCGDTCLQLLHLWSEHRSLTCFHPD